MTDFYTERRRWGDGDPLTGATIALYAGRVGVEVGQLPQEVFMNTVTREFGQEEADYVKQAWAIKTGSQEAVRWVFGTLLQVARPERVTTMLVEMATLAGNSPRDHRDAVLATEYLLHRSLTQAVPYLESLSRAAVRRVVFDL